MTDESGSSQESAGQNFAELERVADDTRNKIRAIVASQQAGRQQTVVATIAIIAILLVFSAVTYFKMKDNFKDSSIQAILKDRGPDLMDNAKRALDKAKDEVVPVYQAEAMARAKVVGPIVLDRAKAHLSDLPEELRDDLEQRLQLSVDRAHQVIIKHLQARFDDIDPETMAGYLEQLRGKFASKEGVLIDKMTKIFNQERDRVHKVMVKLPVKDTTNVDMRELDRQLLKVCLEYATYEVDVSGTDEALDMANLGSLFTMD